MERSYTEALRHARQRVRASHRPVGVAVRCCRPAGEDGARVQVVITNGIHHCAPDGAVLVPRASQRVASDAIEAALEEHALSYPRLTAMRNLAGAVDAGAIDVIRLLEQIQLARRAA